jgi:hypothetical protein
MDDFDATVASPETTRRKFLKLVSAALGALGGLVLAVPLLGSFIGPAFRPRRRHFAQAGTIASLPIDQPVSLSFASETQDAFLQETLRKVIGKGGQSIGLPATMPAWGGILSNQQIHELVKFVRSFCKKP